MPFFLDLFLPPTLSSFFLPTSDIHLESFDVLLCSGYLCVNKERTFGVKSYCNFSDSAEVLWLSQSRSQFDVLSLVSIELNPHAPAGRMSPSPSWLCSAPGWCHILGFPALISNQMHFCALPLPQAPVSGGLLLATSGSHRQTHRSLWVWKLAHTFWDSWDMSKGIREISSISLAPARGVTKEENFLPKRPKFMVLKLWVCI